MFVVVGAVVVVARCMCHVACEPAQNDIPAAQSTEAFAVVVVASHRAGKLQSINGTGAYIGSGENFKWPLCECIFCKKGFVFALFHSSQVQ